MNKRMVKNMVATLFVIMLTLGMAALYNQKNKCISTDIFAMDTYMNLKVYGQNSENASILAKQEIERLEKLFSTGNDDSEVTILNKNKTGKLSEDYAYLLERSIEINRETKGAFDITIYPVMRAWGFTNKEYRVPTRQELDGLLEHVNTTCIDFNRAEGTVALPANVEIDFGGIAKGYTSHRLAQIMCENGVESALLNLGGNIQAVGTKTDGSKWKIAIQSPDRDLDYLGILGISDMAVITSGGYERYFEENGSTYHHIIDPKTGMPAQSGLLSVTIVCEDGTLADGLSTALFVMGFDEAVDYWKNTSTSFDMVLYDDKGKLYITEGLKNDFSSELKYEVIEAANES